MAILYGRDPPAPERFGGQAKRVPPLPRWTNIVARIAINHEADGYWAGAASSEQYAFYDIFLGGTGYRPVAADYDGDGKADPAAYNERLGNWIIGFSGQDYRLASGAFGGHGYQAVPADYDGDGKADPAVYHQDTGLWEVFLSTRGY